ncbi:DUF2971 domain-containing protein [Planococcus sp. CPCC 101016]|uniref:DUF2971 domain-containing protein n=1 Tax=Planococcus sp. CPCC 101016 TaxID=2599617 RepID=UPI0011B4D0D4|nr:DUF2971 domain-containing protein [Planococcus sp. CPCC 101016]TWT04429.1 DUF2971 domain-containing protein [Planococcus sp. CPCC 101016]
MNSNHTLAKELEHHLISGFNKQIKRVQEPGHSLYHYTSLNSLMGMIETNRLWMSKGTFLNDSSELVYFSGVLKNVISKMVIPEKVSLWNLFTEKLEKALDHFMKEIVESGFEVYIFSMSQTEDSLALWYNYARGDGYNIGFSAADLLGKVSAHPDSSAALHGFVVYNKQEQEAVLTNFLLDSFELVSGYEAEQVAAALPNHFFSMIVSCAIFFKDTSFKSEEEYRIAIIGGGKEDDKVKFRARHGVIIPYIEVEFEERLPISHITIGPKNNIDIAKSGVEHYIKSKGYDLDKISVSKSVAALRY